MEGGATAYNEVTNNYLSHLELLDAKRELEACEGNPDCMGAVVTRYQDQSDQNLAAAIADCGASVESCQVHNELHRDALNALHDDRGGELFDISNEARPYLQILMYENIGAEGSMAQATIARSWEALGMSPEVAMMMAALPVGLNRQMLNSRGSGGSVENTGVRITIRDHYEHHNAMRTDVINQLEGQGYRVSDGEASFGSSCGVGRCRPDIIYEAPDGTKGIIEIKTGNADLSLRQTDIFPQIKNGDAIPRGRVAERFGLEPGVPLKDQGYPNGIPIEVREFPGVGE